MNFAYKTVAREAKKQAHHSKDMYDTKVRESVVQPGDIVLMRNVGLKGKHKLADQWNRQPYVVIAQPNKDIPVFAVKKEHGKGKAKLLHRNLLLPFMSIPSKPHKAMSAPKSTNKGETEHLDKISNTTQLSDTGTDTGETGHLDKISDTTQLSDTGTDTGETGHLDKISDTTQLSDTGIDTGETGHQDKIPDTTQLHENTKIVGETRRLNNTTQSVNMKDKKTGPYIIPQRGPGTCKLNPLAAPFVPKNLETITIRRSNRKRRKPNWQLSDNWCLKSCHISFYQLSKHCRKI